MNSRNWIRLPFAGILASFLFLSHWQRTCCGQSTAPPKASSDRIQKSIDSAATMLIGRLKTETDAYAALEATALLKAGRKANEPAIEAVIKRILDRITSSKFVHSGHYIYEAGVCTMCLANADSKKYLPQIRTLAKFIIENQGANGQWHYSGSTEGDTSISQYAMLGLWEAARAGVEIPLEVWDKSAQWHLKFQQKDGGFAYHPDSVGGMNMSSHSMSVAGIGSLQIARLHLYPNAREITLAEQGTKKKVNKSGKRFGILIPVYRNEETDELSEMDRLAAANATYVRKVKLAQLDDGLTRGLNWISENFTVDRPVGYPIYYLYGLERGATLSHKVTLGGHDWYEEGSSYLVQNQSLSGSWVDPSGEGPAAAFGILFLSRATTKMIHQSAPKVSFGTGILIGGRGLPDDLRAAQLNDGKVKKDDKKKTPLEELLAQLDNPQTVLMETTQSEIVERVVIGDRKALIGQVERLKKLAVHKDADVRRTALWALGRSGDLRLAPLLIRGLEDQDVDVYVEARNGLRCLSRSTEDFQPQDDPLDANSRKTEIAKWKAWYREVRDYSERDDLPSDGS